MLGTITPNKLEPGQGQQASEARLLQPHVVVRVQVVESDHRIATRQKSFRDVHANEPGRSCNEKSAHRVRRTLNRGSIAPKLLCWRTTD